MKHLLSITLLLGLPAVLPAQTKLSFGEITLVTPATTPPTYLMNVVMSGSGNTVAGLQFDLNYNPAAMTVTIGLPTAVSAAPISKELSTTTLPAAFNPNINGAANAGPGQRAIIIGAGLNDVSVSATGGPSIVPDGVVATLTVQVTATPAATGQTLTLLGLAGTTAGGQNIAAAAVPITVGVGSNDSAGTGILNTYPTYLAGSVYPSTADTVRTFGSGGLALNDLLTTLFAVTKLTVAGYPSPACGTDRFDAMDLFPLDTATTRGGLRNGTLTLNDLITELSMVTKLPGFTTLPVRSSLPYTCAGSSSLTANAVGPGTRARVAPVVQGTLSLGTRERGGAGQDRVPVYLESQRDLNHLGVAFGLGDERSPLQFQASPELTPSLMQDSTAGVNGAIAVAWLKGIDMRAGQRLLLGYVVGPAPSLSNLKVFGVSASIVDTFQEVGLDVSGAAYVQR